MGVVFLSVRDIFLRGRDPREREARSSWIMTLRMRDSCMAFWMPSAPFLFLDMSRSSSLVMRSTLALSSESRSMCTTADPRGSSAATSRSLMRRPLMERTPFGHLPVFSQVSIRCLSTASYTHLFFVETTNCMGFSVSRAGSLSFNCKGKEFSSSTSSIPRIRANAAHRWWVGFGRVKPRLKLRWS